MNTNYLSMDTYSHFLWDLITNPHDFNDGFDAAKEALWRLYQ